MFDFTPDFVETLGTDRISTVSCATNRQPRDSNVGVRIEYMVSSRKIQRP